jgi:hypothetical protein
LAAGQVRLNLLAGQWQAVWGLDVAPFPHGYGQCTMPVVGKALGFERTRAACLDRLRD